MKVCVSAVDPELFPACVAAGAEMVELGNFDCFYDEVKREYVEELPPVAHLLLVPLLLFMQIFRFPPPARCLECDIHLLVFIKIRMYSVSILPLYAEQQLHMWLFDPRKGKRYAKMHTKQLAESTTTGSGV